MLSYEALKSCSGSSTSAASAAEVADVGGLEDAVLDSGSVDGRLLLVWALSDAVNSNSPSRDADADAVDDGVELRLSRRPRRCGRCCGRLWASF